MSVAALSPKEGYQKTDILFPAVPEAVQMCVRFTAECMDIHKRKYIASGTIRSVGYFVLELESEKKPEVEIKIKEDHPGLLYTSRL
jgi:hypothetical protein